MDELIFFDPNDSEEIARAKLEQFYGEFSDMTRARLLSKRIVRPQNAYDILYPQTRETLLSKNTASNFKHLDKTSEEFRRLLLSKNKENQRGNLSNLSENTRKANISKNKILLGVEELFEKNMKIRDSLISKNKPQIGDLLTDSSQTRQDNVARKKSKKTDLLNDSNKVRQSRVSKITSRITNLLTDSSQTRQDNIARKKGKNSNLLTDSSQTRQDNIARKKGKNSNLLIDSNQTRQDNVARKKGKNSNLLIDSNQTRQDNVARKKGKNSNLLIDSNQTRQDNVARKKGKNTDLLIDSNQTRQDNVARKKGKTTNLLTDSSQTRQGNVARKKGKTTNLLTDSSQSRQDSIARRTSRVANLLTDSNQTRQDNIARKKGKNSNLLIDSNQTRQDNIARKKGKNSNLLIDSNQTRQDNVARKKGKNTNLLTDSNQTRQDNVARRTGRVTNLLTDSNQTRQDNFARRTSRITNLLTDSNHARKDNFARRTGRVTNLLTDSNQSRQDNIARRTGRVTNLLTDSNQARKDNFARRTGRVTNLLTDSNQARKDNFARRTGRVTNLLTDSNQTRQDNIAKKKGKVTNLLTDSSKIRKNNISKIKPRFTNLLSLSDKPRKNLVSKNKLIGGNLLTESNSSRNYSISKIKPRFTNVLSDSTQFRDNLISKNQGTGLIGINIEAGGTSTFLGISRVFVQGILYRNLLLAKNSKKATEPLGTAPVFEKPNGTITGTKITISNPTIELPNPTTTTDEIRNVNIQRTVISKQVSLEQNYGALNQFGVGNIDINKNGTENASKKYFGNKGGGNTDQEEESTKLGYITRAIRQYNLSKNIYNLQKQNPFSDASGYNTLLNHNLGSFQDLIQKSIDGLNTPSFYGTYLKNGDEKSTFADGAISTKINEQGTYLKGGEPDEILKQKYNVGNADIEINPFDDVDFKQGNKGVRAIVKNLKVNDKIKNNLNVQGTKDINGQVYYIGTKDDKGQQKTITQRYTIANPYAPKQSDTLTLFFKNYSNEESMFFPPYVSSFSHQSSVNWNSTNFLGRPEAVYTYNNSSRKGSISFTVLSDYAQNVDIGYNINTANKNRGTEEFTKNFTINSKGVEDNLNSIDSIINEKTTTLTDNYIKVNEGGSVETAVIQENIGVLNQQLTALTTKKWELETAKQPGFNDSDIYNDIMNGGANISSAVGNIETKMKDTKAILTSMKEKLLYQPAFFSGSKIDFVERVEFLEKMTRPSRNNGPGFSFTKPPICHMHLGQWFNHDIIVNNISYDYNDSTWSLDGTNQAQPMLVKVTIDFDIVGIYRTNNAGSPLCSTDKGGYFSDLRSI